MTRTSALLLTGLVLFAAPVDDAPRPLQGRAPDNLVAFTRLLGYVRHFHPSNEVAATNWDHFAVRGVKAVEGARDSAELARVLSDLFRPIAPTVRVFVTGEPVPDPPDLRPPAGLANIRPTAWHHLGVGLSPTSIYSSRRLNLNDSGASDPGFGNLMHMTDATPYRGKRLRYRAAVRAQVSGSGNDAHLWFRVDLPGDRQGFFDNMDARPIVSSEWREYEIIAEVAPDAERLAFGAFLRGKGSAWIDDVSLAVLQDGDRVEPITLPNPGFEAASDGAPPGWITPTPRYVIRVATDNPRSGSRSALITTEIASPTPDPSEPYRADLGGGVSCLLPIALYVHAGHTLPRGSLETAPDVRLTGNDRATRLAAIALVWNVFQHFYPYFDVVKADWPGALRRALARAATDSGELAFLDTLRRLVGELRDGHGNVTLASEQRVVPPIEWRWIDNGLVVTRVNDASVGISLGDLVVRVNDKPAEQALAEAAEFVSAATPQHGRFRTASRLLSGAPGSVLQLDLRRASGESFSARLTRNIAAKPEPVPSEKKVYEIRPGIHYVDLRAITDAEFEAAVPKLAAAKGIVFELRGYPRVGPTTIGHLIDDTITCARWNVPIVLYPDRQKMGFQFSNWTVQPKAPRFRAKVAFLTDGRAISYSETYLGMIEHYKLGDIVGEATAGTNGNINPFTLPGGYRVVWTGMKVLKHDGSQHHGVGIQPTVRVSPTLAGIAAGRDEVLERALEIVGR
jgi:C-terminal processing protease CtpA/Prc